MPIVCSSIVTSTVASIRCISATVDAYSIDFGFLIAFETKTFQSAIACRSTCLFVYVPLTPNNADQLVSIRFERLLISALPKRMSYELSFLPSSDVSLLYNTLTKLCLCFLNVFQNLVLNISSQLYKRSYSSEYILTLSLSPKL